MLDDQIKKIQSEIEKDNTLNASEREKLFALSEELHQELIKLEKTHKKGAQHIAEHMHQAVHNTSPQAVSSLKEMICEFEVTHPNLTRIIQTLCAQFGV